LRKRFGDFDRWAYFAGRDIVVSMHDASATYMVSYAKFLVAYAERGPQKSLHVRLPIGPDAGTESGSRSLRRPFFIATEYGPQAWLAFLL
jgi:hypothetical protein